MRPIPKGLRKRLSEDPFMAACCIPDCLTPPEWEHSWTYARKQINEGWAIVPMCMPHHRGSHQTFAWRGEEQRTKEFGQWVSLCRGIKDAIQDYPRRDWEQEKRFLDSKFLHD